MKDQTQTQYNSNSPQKNFVKIMERLEKLERKLNVQELTILDLLVSK